MTAAGAAPDVHLVRAPRGADGTSFDAEMLRVFREALTALTAGQPVVALVHEEDILGRGEPLDAAAAHAVVGLVRGLAIEGAKEGWRINAIAVPSGEQDADLAAWSGRLAVPAGATGIVLRLGPEHLGRVGL